MFKFKKLSEMTLAEKIKIGVGTAIGSMLYSWYSPAHATTIAEDCARLRGDTQITAPGILHDAVVRCDARAQVTLASAFDQRGYTSEAEQLRALARRSGNPEAWLQAARNLAGQSRHAPQAFELHQDAYLYALIAEAQAAKAGDASQRAAAQDVLRDLRSVMRIQDQLFVHEQLVAAMREELK